MKRRLVEGLIGLMLGGALLGWVLRDFSWAQFSLIQVRWFWVVLGGVAMIAAHLLRVWRWVLMLRGSEQAIPFGPAFWGLMVGYLVNTALPRVGEVLRCTLLWRWAGVPVAISLGSVVAERLIDFLLLALLSLTVVAVEGLVWIDTLGLRPYLPWIGAVALVGLLLVGIALYALRRRAHRLLGQLMQGFLGVLRARPYLLTAALSLLIWAGYWAAIYGVMEAASPEDSVFLAWSAWVLLVGSGVAMALPVPGGIGTFHAIGLGLLLALGWDKNTALVTVLAAHALQTLLIIMLGGLGLLYGALQPFPLAVRAKAP